jgi:hypothetical protein
VGQQDPEDQLHPEDHQLVLVDRLVLGLLEDQSLLENLEYLHCLVAQSLLEILGLLVDLVDHQLVLVDLVFLEVQKTLEDQ